jgi:iron complex outermembrane receptor protein
VSPEDIGPFVGAPPGVVLFDSIQTSAVDTKSWAVFAHQEYDIATEWTLIGSLRYTEDEREIDYVLEDNFGTFQQFNTALFSEAKQEFENVSAKVEIDWKPNDDWLVYASVNRGHKAGNFSTPFIGPVDLPLLPHDEEVLTSYELGFKSTLLDGLARLNANVFYYDYADYQASFFNNFALIIQNVDATLSGAEVELTLNPIDRLEFMFGVSLLDGEAEDVGMPDGSLQDRDMPYAPDVSFNALARYTLPLKGGAELTFQADANYSSDFCFTVVCHPLEEEDSYTVGNARITYSSPDQSWSFAAFVRNIGDKEYRVFALDGSFVGWSQYAYGAPRWAGIEASYSWR